MQHVAALTKICLSADVFFYEQLLGMAMLFAILVNGLYKECKEDVIALLHPLARPALRNNKRRKACSGKLLLSWTGGRRRRDKKHVCLVQRF